MGVGQYVEPRDQHMAEWSQDGALEFDAEPRTCNVAVEVSGQSTPWFDFDVPPEVTTEDVVLCVQAALDGATPENTPELGDALAEGLNGDLNIVADVPEIPVDRAGAVVVSGAAEVRIELPYDATVPERQTTEP